MVLLRAIALVGVVFALAEMAGTRAGAGGTVQLKLLVAVEKVRYEGGFVARHRPFKPLYPGEVAFVRVAAERVGDDPPLRSGRAALRLEFAGALPGEGVVLVERDGVRACTRTEATVTCPITRVLRDGEGAAVLLAVAVPDGHVGDAIEFNGSIHKLAAIDVNAKAASDFVATRGNRGWTGQWHWSAKWTGGSFESSGMRVYESRTRRAVCARWDWSGGGMAYGALEHTPGGEVWNAQWRDGFGSGTWRLRINAPAAFKGTQHVDPHGRPAPFRALITGRQDDDFANPMDCEAIRKDLQAGTSPGSAAAR